MKTELFAVNSGIGEYGAFTTLTIKITIPKGIHDKILYHDSEEVQQIIKYIEAYDSKIKDTLQRYVKSQKVENDIMALGLIKYNPDGTLEISDELAFAIVKRLRLCSIKGE